MLDFAIQFLCTVLLLVGLWLMGDKRLSGVLMACISEGFTFVVGVQHHVWSIIVIGFVLFFVQGRNFIKWHAAGERW